MARKKTDKNPLREGDFGRWRLIGDFQERLSRQCEKAGLEGSFADRRRKLEVGQYLSLFLFRLLNPVVRTMRGLCEASELGRLQREVCDRRVSLGSFSEAQAVLDPALLKGVFEELAREAGARGGVPKGSARGCQWVIVDSTVWEMVPRMAWGFWRKQGNKQNAVRLHLELDLQEDAPARATVTTARVCERQAWKESWEAGVGYIGDRNYGEDYKNFAELEKKGCCFILRLRDACVWEGEGEQIVDEQAREAGVLDDEWGHLGCSKKYRSQRVRRVRIAGEEGEVLLVTNLSAEEASAHLIGELYRKRWQVELFFRWIKCILGNRHWLAESQRGVTMQIYLALIAALLLQLHGTMRPSKRLMERIELYLMGMATLEELEAGLAREIARHKARSLAKKS